MSEAQGVLLRWTAVIASGIVTYAYSNNVLLSASQINIIVDTAYGLFQYIQPTWNARYSNRNILDDDDQIWVMLLDIIRYQGRYASGIASNQTPASIGLQDYLEIKHHLGDSSTDWTSSIVSQYNMRTNTFGFRINGI